MEGGDINEEKEGGQRGPLGGPYRDRSRYIGRLLEDESTLPSCEEEGDPVDQVRGYAFGEKKGSQFRRIDVVETGLYVEEEGGDLQKRPVKGSDFVGEGGHRVGGAGAGKGATLVWVE